MTFLVDKVKELKFGKQKEQVHDNKFDYQFHQTKEGQSDNTMVLSDIIAILVLSDKTVVTFRQTKS